MSILCTGVAHATAPASSGGLCQAQDVQDPLVQGRARSVRFPDGRVITVVGHDHGTRQIYQIGPLVQGGFIRSMSDQDFNALLSRIQSENQRVVDRRSETWLQSLLQFSGEVGIDISHLVLANRTTSFPLASTMDHAIADRQYVIRSLQGPVSRVQFIGAEISQEALGVNYPQWQAVRDSVLQELRRRQVRGQMQFDEQQVNEILMSSVNGNIYPYLENRSLAQRVPLVGVEDWAAGAAYERVGDPIGNLHAAKDRLFSQGQQLFANLSTDEERLSFYRDQRNGYPVLLAMYITLAAEFMKFTSMDELNVRLNELERIAPDWMRAHLPEFLRAARERVRLNLARDEASARNLAARFQTGIHFVGINHFFPTLNYLEQICREEMSGSAASEVPSANRAAN